MSTQLLKLGVHTFGRLSKGINLSLDEGLTSGKTLEYIYQNRPQGISVLGRYLDSKFLNHPGWEAVRTRKQHLEDQIHDAIDELQDRGHRVHILDIASGPALYLRQAVNKYDPDVVTATAQDIERRWLKEGKEAAQREGIHNIDYQYGDAFSPDDLQKTKLQPNVVVSSGFYDWIQDDALVKKSLNIIYELLEKDAHFILTNQVSHPNQTLVERIFPGFDGTSLQMKMRSVPQVSSWLIDIGFRIEAIATDNFGYYSVFHARKSRK